MNQTTKQIRFAPLIRVSEVSMKEKQTSLINQREQILQYVETMKGIIPPDLMDRYSGQEHGTPEFERKKFDQLIEDAGKDMFDAVIVVDASRWSRDVVKGQQALDQFKRHNIKLYLGLMQIDPYQPEQEAMLNQGVTMAQMHARVMAMKSLQSKIVNAKRNIPSVGKLPYGREFDKKTKTWSVDPSKQLIIEQTAERYLNNEVFPDIAKSYNISTPFLWKVLTTQSGDKWINKFNSDRFNIHDEITLNIPRLLPESTIKLIHKKSAEQKTYIHGQQTHPYLLARKIFHESCGYAMQGFTNHNGRMYYRRQQDRCTLSKMLRADQIEPAVMLALAKTFGNRKKMQEAVEAAIPKLSKIANMKKEKTKLLKQAANCEKQRKNLIKSVAKGLLSDKDIEAEIAEIRALITSTQNRIDVIDAQLDMIPDSETIKKSVSSLGLKIGLQVSKDRPEWILNKPYEWKRDFIEQIFPGLDPEGKRYGVYVEYISDKNWKFRIHGAFGDHTFEMKNALSPYFRYLPKIYTYSIEGTLTNRLNAV